MDGYQIFSLAALGYCLLSLIYHFYRIVKAGKPKDLSQPIGSPGSATTYAFIKAMSPAKKESAFLHLPTYIAGIIYHIGTFSALIIFFVVLSGTQVPEPLNYLLAGVLTISGLSGFGILFKRMLKAQMRDLSNPDDYLSNFLVSIFHLITAAYMIGSGMKEIYFVISGILLLYIPAGKLKHTVYFFAARYHLGFFYGWRGVWPQKKY